MSLVVDRHSDSILLCILLLQTSSNLLHAVMTLSDSEVCEILRPYVERQTKLVSRSVLNKRGMYGETPLMAAVLLKSTRTVSMMIDGGANVDAQDGKGTTSLMLAAVRGNARTANVLLDAGATLKTRDSEGKTALHYAIQESRREVVEVLVERGSWDFAYGPAEVMAAYQAEQPSLGKMMICHGMYDNMELIRVCMVKERYGIMEDMLEESMRRRDSCNLALICKNILSFACGCGRCCNEERERIHHSIGLFRSLGCSELLRDDALRDAFWDAGIRCELDTLTLVHDMIRSVSPSLRVVDYYPPDVCQGYTVLMLLMKKLHARLDSGDGPSMTVKNEIRACVTYLLDCDADTTVRDVNGRTPLHYAVYSTDIDTVKCMLDHWKTRITSFYWGAFNSGERFIQPKKSMQTNVVNLADVDITSDGLPWARACCDSCNTLRKIAMQQYILGSEGVLPSGLECHYRVLVDYQDVSPGWEYVDGWTSTEDEIFSESRDYFDSNSSSDDEEEDIASPAPESWWAYLVKR